MMTRRVRKIAKLLMAGAALAAFSTSAQADQLIENVDGIRIDENGQVDRFNALHIGDDGRIVAVLDRRDKRPADVDYLLDAKGQVLLPGMIDAHVHVMDYGFARMTLDLSETRSLEEALEAIRVFAEQNPARPWILGRGWNQETWGLGRFPTAAELDSVVSDRPVWLQRADNHAAWGNTLALEAAGITAQTADPAGGRIERLPNSREPSGVFVDEAEKLVGAVVPAPRPAERDLALREAQEGLHAEGITAVADMGTTIEDWQAFRRAGDRGALTLRIMAYAAGADAMTLIGGPGPTPWLYDDRLRLNGVKLYLDGALGSRGAWLKQPYADDPGNTGLPLMSSATFRNTLVRAAQGGFQPAIHAIGTAANEDALSAIAEVSESYSGDLRWRIEHAQIVDPVDIPTFGNHGIIASFQPVHQTSDRLMAEARLGPNRLEGAYAWASVAATGARLAFGSDAPVERPDPFEGFAVAFTRTDANGEPFGGWRAQEAVSREAALRAFTSDAAYAGFAEGKFGRLVAGERADFILVDRDPLLASPEDIRTITVRETWVGGKRVFASGEAQ